MLNVPLPASNDAGVDASYSSFTVSALGSDQETDIQDVNLAANLTNVQPGQGFHRGVVFMPVELNFGGGTQTDGTTNISKTQESSTSYFTLSEFLNEDNQQIVNSASTGSLNIAADDESIIFKNTATYATFYFTLNFNFPITTNRISIHAYNPSVNNNCNISLKYNGTGTAHGKTVAKSTEGIVEWISSTSGDSLPQTLTSLAIGVSTTNTKIYSITFYYEE